MTGKQLAAAIKAHKGVVFVPTNWNGDPWIMAVKKDLIGYFRRKGSEEMLLKLDCYADRAYVNGDFDAMQVQLAKEIAEDSRY